SQQQSDQNLIHLASTLLVTRLCLSYSSSFFSFFFFNDPATTEIYTLPYTTLFRSVTVGLASLQQERAHGVGIALGFAVPSVALRSEEHTSELQSQSNLVCRLLLEKKNTTYTYPLSSNHTQ